MPVFDEGASAEALFISALLELGEFTPSEYGIDETSASEWQHVWSFCIDHQNKIGCAPSLQLIHRSFPDFKVIPDVDARWAADQLRKQVLRRQVSKSKTRLQQARREREAALASETLPSQSGTSRGSSAETCGRRFPR